MTSKERVLAVLSREQPDRVPIAMRGMEPLNHLWRDRFERAIVLRDRFGIDDFLYTPYKWVYDPAVEEKRRWETHADTGRPLLVTDYLTPAGVLHNEVVMTDDFHVERLQLAADGLMPRMLVRTLRERDDVQRFRYLLPSPTDCDLSSWDEEMRSLASFGRDEEFPVGVYIPCPSNVAMKNMGTLELVMRATDGDPMVQEMFDVLTEWTLQWIDYAAQFERVSEHFAHGDFMTHRAGLYALVPRGDEPDLRGFEARHLSRRTAARPMVSLDYPPGGTRTGRSFGMRPDRHEFAIATLGSVRFHAFDTLATSCAPIATRTDRNVRAIEYSRDGRHLILGNDHRALRVYERRGESWQLITERKLSGPIASVATIGGNDASGPSDEQVAVYTEDGKLQVLLLSDLSVVRVQSAPLRKMKV